MMDTFKLSIGTKNLAVAIGIVAITIGVIFFTGLEITRNALQARAFETLTAIREMKAQQIEDYFGNIRNQVMTLSQSRTAIDAMREFSLAFAGLSADPGPGLDAESDGLENYYEKEFVPRLTANLDATVELKSYVPQDPRVNSLQRQYIAENPHPTGEKHRLNFAPGDSTYSRTHRFYHPIFRSYLERFGYYDIFLVEPVTGHIVYSVFKEVDFATSLHDGPYSATNFAQVFRAAFAAQLLCARG